jgi:serine/threonine-protein kinase
MAPESVKLPKVPGYTFKGVLGKGANGVVYRAVQESMQRDVAIKFLAPKFAKIPGYIDNFVKEARAAAKLSHPNIILGIDVGDVGGVYYFVMEYVEGRMLRDILKDRRRLPEAEALRILAQIARALEHAGRNGFVHRDVKPANVMVTPDGTAKLCDLGLAVSVKDEKGKPKTLAGTPYYISPEQAKAEPNIDIRSDLYSLGATLFHCLTGEPPFKGENPDVVIARHLTDPPPSPRSRVAEITGRTSDLVVQMMAKDRARRPQSAGKLADEMVKCADLSEKAAAMGARRSTADRVARRGPNLVPIAAGAAALLVVVVGGYLMFGGRSDPPKKNGGGSSANTTGGGDAAPDASPAEADLAALKQKAEADAAFEKIAEIAAAPDEFKKRHSETWAQKANLEVVGPYLERLEARMAGEFARLEKQSDDLAGQGRLREALSAFDAFPKSALGHCPSGRKVEQQRADLRLRIDQRLARDKEEFVKLTERGQLAEAEAHLNKMELYALDTGWISGRRSELKDLRAGRMADLRKEADAQYSLLDADFRKLMGQRKFGEAIRAVVAFLDRDWKAEILPFVRVEGFVHADLDPAKTQEIVDRCEKVITEAPPTAGMYCVLSIRNAAEVASLVAEAERAVPPLAESMEKVNLATYGGAGYFRRNSTGMVEYVVEGKGRYDLEVIKYEVADLDKLAATLKPDPARHLGRVGLAYFYSGRQEHFAKAGELLTRAADQGYRGARAFAQNLSQVREADLAVRIQKLWGDAQAAAKARKWVEADQAVAELTKLKEHPAVKPLQPQIDQLKTQIQSNLGALGDLEKQLRGKVVAATGGRATVRYDFSDPAQLQAFEAVDALPGRWTVENGLLRSAEKPCAIRWTRPVGGDVTVSFDLSARECRNINTTLYYDPASGGKHYTVHLGLDVASGKDDPADTLEKKRGLPRYTIVKYPTKGIPVGAYRVHQRSFWTGWQKSMVGKAADPAFEMPLGKKVRVTVERAGSALRLKVDAALIWEGVDAEYRQGSVLFYSESRVELSNLEITFGLGS